MYNNIIRAATYARPGSCQDKELIMKNNKIQEAADLLKAAIEDGDMQHFSLEKLGVKVCVDELNRCIDVLINDMCLVSLFDFMLETADLRDYGCLIRNAAVIASYNYAKGIMDEAIKFRGIMTWEKMGEKLEGQNNG